MKAQTHYDNAYFESFKYTEYIQNVDLNEYQLLSKPRGTLSLQKNVKIFIKDIKTNVYINICKFIFYYYNDEKYI